MVCARRMPCSTGKIDAVTSDGGSVKRCVEGCLAEDTVLTICDCYTIA